MRNRAPILLLVLLVLLAGCDLTGISTAPTPTPTTRAVAPSPTTAEAEATSTKPAAAQKPTATTRAGSTPPTTATAEAQASPIATVAVSESERRQLDAILEETVRIRGLEPKAEVSKSFITREQLRANLLRDIGEDYTQEESRQDAQWLWLMRLTGDRTLNIYELYIDLLTEQVAGYYDPEKDELFVLRESEELSLLTAQTMSHELVHSLQDQHYDLEKLLPDDSKDDDRILATQALVEGDATLAGQAYLLQNMQEGDLEELMEEAQNIDTAVLDSAPRYIREALLFPYVQGSEFVQKLLDEGDIERVDRALTDPPASTEQILHPEKYLDAQREEPQVVALAPLTGTLGTGWTLKDSGSLGEFDLQIMLDENEARRPNQAAAGWGGGGYALYESGDEALLLTTVAWDTAKDADEYVTALDETFAQATEQNGIRSRDGRYFGTRRVGDTVTLIAASSQEPIEKAFTAIK